MFEESRGDTLTISMVADLIKSDILVCRSGFRYGICFEVQKLQTYPNFVPTIGVQLFDREIMELFRDPSQDPSSILSLEEGIGATTLETKTGVRTTLLRLNEDDCSVLLESKNWNQPYVLNVPLSFKGIGELMNSDYLNKTAVFGRPLRHNHGIVPPGEGAPAWYGPGSGILPWATNQGPFMNRTGPFVGVGLEDDPANPGNNEPGE